MRKLPNQHFHLGWHIMVEQIWLVVLFISIMVPAHIHDVDGELS